MATLNGWPEASQVAVVRIVAGGDRDGATVLAGDVAAAFVWLLEQFHARVEPITEVNGWRSAAFNKQIGGAARSNHISGTAVDVNGARHPFERHHPGKRYSSGFTDAQARTVRAILREAGGLFRWGLDFPVGKRDAMHFELASGTTTHDVAAFVARITPPPAPTPAVITPKGPDMVIIRNGSRVRVVAGDMVSGLSSSQKEAEADVERAIKAGIPVWDVSAGTFDALRASFVPEKK
ncbi:hypothetical protein CWIS_13540 [Cellulomonas sp. A375-1]|uniref:M15 family metallopeptidase n=1 Tax=Cellulomonas sp. A375-1 TaxID=1672219 RepID=UPI00065284DB|nr:M15 family metallopeptidase [Cellulomonas sp. A375-1]KMM44852.1 hypothetical protein CWIS_13540 [Cellulomonas sp. A375-1]